MTYKLQKKIHSALDKIKAASVNLYYQKNIGLELEFDLSDLAGLQEGVLV